MKYSLTTVPLAFRELDQTLRQESTKATLCWLLYEKSDSLVKETPDEADWLVDGMATVPVVSPQEIYKDFAGAILSYYKQKDVTCSESLTIISDSYKSTSIKQSNQIKRGQPGRRVFIASMV